MGNIVCKKTLLFAFLPAYVPEMVGLLRIQNPLKKLYTKKSSKRIIYQMERIRMKAGKIFPLTE
jgi:hypothetical protein